MFYIGTEERMAKPIFFPHVFTDHTRSIETMCVVFLLLGLKVSQLRSLKLQYYKVVNYKA